MQCTIRRSAPIRLAVADKDTSHLPQPTSALNDLLGYTNEQLLRDARLPAIGRPTNILELLQKETAKRW